MRSQSQVRRRRPILGADEYEGLLAECAGHPMLCSFVLLVGEAGLTAPEALQLDWADIDLWTGMATIGGRRARRVPLTRRLCTALHEHASNFAFASYGGRRVSTVLHHVVRRGRAEPGDPIRSLGWSFREAVVRAGLYPRLQPLDLRYRRYALWVRDGKPLYLVRAALGYSIDRLFPYYHAPTDVELLRLVEEPRSRRSKS